MNIEDLKGKNIHIVGATAIEGSAILEFLWNHNIRTITTHDFCEQKDMVRNFSKSNPRLTTEERKVRLDILKHSNLTVHFKDTYLEGIENADLIFAGQAWYKYECNFPKLQDAKQSGIPLKTIINLYLDLFPGTTIGITGSNGKTTVSSLTHRLLTATTKHNVYISGNIDSEAQSLNKITNASPNDFLILEISNRQLKLLGGSHPDFALITNITENHLDEHENIEEYAKIKFKICQNSHPILNNKDPLTKKHLPETLNPTWFNNPDILKEFKLESKDLKIPGTHNLENLYAALHILKTLKTHDLIELNPAQIKSSLNSFTSIPKRLEIIGEKNNVKIINDLSSTTPISTLAAIEAFQDHTFSIVIGCNHKGSDYGELIKKLKELTLTGILQKIFLLPGTIAETLKEDHNFKLLPIQEVTNFEEIAKLTSPTIGEYLLISPSGEKVISVHLKKSSLQKIFKI